MNIRKLLMQFFFLLFTFAVYAQNVDKTKDIGEISYSSSSTPTGAFTYDVPIDIYPGKNGTQPSLSLSYNSQNLNLFSVLGVGWSLGGLSEISRSQTNQYYDNITTSSPIKEGINVFALDGLRLVNSNDVNYTYQTEEGNIYIKVKDNYTKFEVYYPNGTIAFYGLGTHKYSYPITKLVDPLGNYIDYTYSSENNRFYIHQISYNSNENIEIGKIKFVYKQNDFEKFVYIDGLQIKTTKRISEINCYFGSLMQHSYSIDYKKSGNNYFIEKVNYNSSGKSLNPLTFEYGSGLKPSIQKSETSYTKDSNSMISIPINWNAEASREGYFMFPSNLNVGGKMYIYHSKSNTMSTESITLPDIENILAGDIDGDLNEEVITIHYSYPDGKNDLWFRTIRDYDNNTINQFLIKDFPENRTFLLGDFRGRGKADLLMIAYAKDSKGNSRNAIATFIDFEKKTKGNTNSNFLKILPEDYLLLIDFDGDGAVELLVISKAGASVYKIDSDANYTLMTSLPLNNDNIALDIAHTAIGTSKILIGDINNDGKTDIVVSPKLSVRGKCYVHMGPCKGGCIRQASAEETFNSKGESFDEIWMGPLGEQCLVRGVEDCFTTDGGTTWTVYLSNGKDKFDTKTFSGSRNMSSNISQSPDQFTLFDVNGDNLLDLIRVSEFDSQITAYYNEEGIFSSTATYIDKTKIERGTLSTTNGAYRYGNHGKGFAISNDEKIVTYYDANADKNQLLMTKAVSSYGSATILEYAKIDNSLVYYNHSSKGDAPVYPWAKIPYGTDLLHNRKDSISNIKTNELYFKYNYGLVHLQGLGFKGFEKVEIKDNIDNTRSITQEFDPKNWSVLKSQKSITSEGSYDYNYTIATNKARAVTLKSKAEKDLLKDLSVTTSYIYDTYGNPTKETVVFTDKIEKITDIEYNNFTTGTSYLLGQVKTKTVTNKLNGITSSSKTSMEYYANNQLKSQKSYYGNNLVATNTYTYDKYNNLSESKSKAYEYGNELTSKSEYDNIGRLKRETDPLGLYTDYIYNTIGQLSSVKNYKGQETKYEYDSWGRKVKTTYPDGTVESVKMDWTSNIADLDNLDANSNYGDLKIEAPLSKGASIVACHSISLTPGFSHKAADKGTLSLKIDPNSCSTPPTPSGYNNPLYIVTVIKTGSPTSKVYYDAMGRELRKGELRFDGRYLYTDVVYDDKSRVKKQSLPFKGNAPSLWNTYNYDKYSRMTSLLYASGKKDSIRYVNNSITSIIDNIETTKKYNVLGQIKTVTDPAGTISYKYRPDGQPESIIPPRESKVSESVIKTSFEYDGYGRQTAIIDPSAGRRSFGYDAAGNINKEIDADNKVTNMVYDPFNRLISKVVDEITTTYKYDLKNGLLQSASNTNRTVSYGYDNLDRLLTEKESIIDEKFLQKTFAYSNGNVSSVAYKSQSGDIVTQNYDYTNGHNTEIKLNNSTSIWKLTAENSLGMPTNATTGALTRTYGYTNFGLPTSRVVKNGSAFVQNFGYDIDPNTKNLNWRKDNIRNITENFKYDGLNRLETVSGKVNYTMAYDVMGNITNNGNVGQFEYKHETKPYALTDATSNIIPNKVQNIVYNAQLRPTSITENGYVSTFSYNGNGDRIKMSLNKGTLNQLTRYYIGGQYEIDGGADGDKERLYLDGDAYTAVAVYVKQNGKWEVQYICRDHLGSVTHVTNSAGTLLQELSYDPWGRLRNPIDQKVYAVYSEPTPILGRGYTGHEHLQTFGLINMNARLYDPVVGRFLSPDPYVQAPDMSQNFNRYSYALNNPLMYTDPSGKFLNLIMGGIMGGTLNWASNGFQFNAKGLASFAVGTTAGFLSAGIGSGISATMVGGSFSSGFLGNSTISSIGFFSGGASGFTSGLSNGLISSFGNNLINGSNIGNSILSGLRDGFKQGLASGVTNGTYKGLQSSNKELNFFTGRGTFDITNGVGAHGISEYLSKVKGTYVGQYENVIDVFESTQLEGGAVTLPKIGIFVNPGDFSKKFDMDLVRHEFGHFLQAKDIGINSFYRVVAPASLASAIAANNGYHDHNTFWTETWANYLSSQYHQAIGISWDPIRFPIKNISDNVHKALKYSDYLPTVIPAPFGTIKIPHIPF